MLFLERRAGFLRMRIDRRMPEALRELAGLAAADIAFDVDIVPVSLFWGRAPDRERSWLRLLVAEGWDIGGRFRKVLSLLLNGRNLLMLFGERHGRCSRRSRRRAGCRAVRAGCGGSCGRSSAASAPRPSARTCRTAARSSRRC